MTKQWKKIILSGSDAHLASITSSGGIHAVGSLGISASVIHLFNGDGTGGSFTSASLAGAGGGASTATQIPMGGIPQPFPGFFDTFLTSTTVAETIEEISTAFASIAPAQPQGLTGANLNKSLPNNSNTFTGLLAGGLDTNHWNGLTAHSSYTFHKSADIRLTTPDGTGTTNRRFRAGKYANLFPDNILEGGVTSSKRFRSDDPTIIDDVPLSSGTVAGPNGKIRITELVQYEELWAKAEARLDDTLAGDDTGSIRYRISADNGAGESNEYTIRYVGNSTHFPDIDVVSPSNNTVATVSDENLIYLSGQAYYGAGTKFTITAQVNNLFNPVYTNSNQGAFSNGSITNTSAQNIGSPNHNDQYNKNFTITVQSGKTSNDKIGDEASLVFKKAGKNNTTKTIILGNKGINSRSTPSNANNQSQNVFNVEDFYTETHRKTNASGQTAFDNEAALTDGNLAVVNGRLRHAIGLDSSAYSSFSSLNQNYFRIFTPNAPRESGRIEWSCDSEFNNLSLFGSETGNVEMALHILGRSEIFDLALEAGFSSGNIIGIKVPPFSSTDKNGINFQFPLINGVNVNTTPTNHTVLQIKFNIAVTDAEITEVKLKFT